MDRLEFDDDDDDVAVADCDSVEHERMATTSKQDLWLISIDPMVYFSRLIWIMSMTMVVNTTISMVVSVSMCTEYEYEMNQELEGTMNYQLAFACFLFDRIMFK
jgi:hypothetical protein